MSDKINEDNGLSRLLTLAGIKPTLIIMPTNSVEATDEEATDEEAEAEMQHSDARVIDTDIVTPSKKAQRKLRFVPARQGDNPIVAGESLEEKESRLADEYQNFKLED